MPDFASAIAKRVAFIKAQVSEARADGIVYGNSGGKDSALVGILCKMACENTVGLIMPCGSQRNYTEDKADAETVAAQYHITARIIDLAPVRDAFVRTVNQAVPLTRTALANISPRLRMTTLYAVAAAENRLVAGTGNRSEGYMGYFTKWGDGACDFNPIADLTVSAVYAWLRFLNAPAVILNKAPSAGLFDGQTDESEMGVTYAAIDAYLETGHASARDKAIIEKFHRAGMHKHKMPVTYEGTTICK